MKLINELESSLLILQDKLSSHSSKSTAIQMLLALWMDEKAQFQFMMAGGLQHLVNNLNVIDDKLFLNLVHSITFLAQSSSTSHRFKNSFPRVMMMETKLLNVLVDIVNIHLLEDSKSSQMRVKMSIHILDSILECYNPKDQMMEKYVWRNSDNCLGSLIMNVLVTILNTKNEKCSKIIIRMIYKWIRKDPKAFHLLVNRFDQYLPAFVHTMRNTEEIDLKGAILAILHTVTNDSKSRSLLIKSEYLTEQAVHLLKTTKKQIQQSAVNYLASICVGCPKIPSLILSANVLPILISILRENHTEHYTMDTLILVREVLQKEVVDPNLLNCEANGIWTILNAVGKNYKSSILQSVALDLFLHLANDVRYLQMISKWQGLESIISKLLSEDDIKRRQAAVVIMSHIYQMTTPNLEVKNKDNELELRCSDNKKRRNPIEGSEQDEIEQPWKSIKTES